MRLISLSLVFFAGVIVAGCGDPPAASSSYFDENIQPILQVGCVMQTTGCHLADDQGRAAGNLDLSSYDALMRREDVLAHYGPYPVPLLLLKAGDPQTVAVDTFGPPGATATAERLVMVTTDIRHNAGMGIGLDSSAYRDLLQWIQSGYRRTGAPVFDRAASIGSCRGGPGSAPGFSPGEAPADGPSFERFRSEVQPVLRSNCSGGNCHGSPIADLHLSCGDSEEELRWNYWIALQHVTEPASQSEILRRPLAVTAGGTFHEGGDVFGTTDEAEYLVIRSWAEDIVERAPDLLRADDADDGLRFFANRVQPMLVRKGCLFLNCHSPAMGHDLRLRGGSQGSFSRVAIRRNYEISRLMLAIESQSPNDSRIIAKNLYEVGEIPDAVGLAHRGGSLFEDFGVSGTTPDGATPDDCAGLDADTAPLDEIPAYCVLVRWHAIEREQAIARGEIDAAPVRGVAYVERPLGVGNILDFDTYRPGADLRLADATIDPVTGAIGLSGGTSLLGTCADLSDAAGRDVRTPAVSWDGTTLAFAARTSADAPLRLYQVNADGTGCMRIAGVAAGEDRAGDVLTHDFDPAYAPDGRLVFASTRRGRRTAAALQPNADLYVFDGTTARALTHLNNQELAPSFMADGRVIFTSEKRAAGFHQLAGRRQNVDGGDYHPLYAQRTSIGFDAATEIVELANRNFAATAGPVGTPDGGGTIAIANRSIGVDQTDRDPGDRFYIHSLRQPLAGRGVFRSFAPMPGSRFVASCNTGITDPMAAMIDWDLCEIDPHAGTASRLLGAAGRAEVEAVAVYARPQNGVVPSRIDEPNGTVRFGDTAGITAELHVLDFGLLATLLFENTRNGRPIDTRIAGFDVLVAEPPPAGASLNQSDDLGMFFESTRVLGNVPLQSDGSARVILPAETPFRLRPTDSSGRPLAFGEGAPFAGEMIQREEMQLQRGERNNTGFQRRLFNGICGQCHGSISNRELDVAVNVDILTSASRTVAAGADAVDLSD